MSINTDNIAETIQKIKPNAKPNTIKQYEALLKRLKTKTFESDNYDFLSEPKDVEDKLKDKAYTSVRNTYNAIIVLLNALNSENKYDDLIKEYSDMRDVLNDKYVDENKTSIISDKQAPNFAEFNEIQNMLRMMEVHFKDNNIKTKKKLDSIDKQILTAYTIFQMLLLITTRNDFSDLVIINKLQYNKLSDTEKADNNYLVKGKNKTFFVYNNYKTSEKIIDMPKSLNKYINSYIKLMDRKYGENLFVSGTGGKLTRNMASQLLLKMSKKYIGKSVSSTMMKKIVASHNFANVKKEQEALAEKMGHSVDLQNLVYVKEKQDE
mgnify:CR=1 FL=1|tara:strand:+ start:3203 stop:4168 length:966 start_codon:yes stop_codon:yes gene_type:complete